MGQFLNNLADPTKIVAANVVPGEGFETIIRPSLIVKAGTVKLGVTAVVDPESIAKLSDPDKDELLPTVKRPDEVLPSVFAELEGKSDYQILMVQAPPEEAKRLASAYPGFDVVVSTSSARRPGERPPDAQRRQDDAGQRRPTRQVRGGGRVLQRRAPRRGITG